MMPCLLAAYAAAAENVQMRVWVNAQEEVVYKVDFEGHHVIGASPLGLNIDNRPYGKEVIALEADTLSEDHILYTVKQQNDRAFQIETKVFDDGMALRYHIPTDGKPVCIYGEETSYQFPQGTRTWYASGPFQYGWVQAYQDRKVEALEGELRTVGQDGLVAAAALPRVPAVAHHGGAQGPGHPLPDGAGVIQTGGSVVVDRQAGEGIQIAPGIGSRRTVGGEIGHTEGGAEPVGGVGQEPHVVGHGRLRRAVGVGDKGRGCGE